jgi:hypothetical protein
MATNNAINMPFPLDVVNGGTGASSLLDHGVLVGSGTNAVTALSVGTDNSLLMGNSGADPAFTTTGTPYVSGLTFDGTNTISYYEEGTWTPTAYGGPSSTNTTYTAQTGYYTRIGNLVFGYGYVAWSAMSYTGIKAIHVGGLPYTIKNQTQGYTIAAINISSDIAWSNTSISNALCIGPTSSIGTTHFDFQLNKSGNLIGPMYVTSSSGGSLNISFFYEVA